MSEDDRPTREDAFLLSLARGRCIRDAAAEAEISEATGYRWMRDRSFLKRLTEMRSELWSAALAELSQAAAQAVKTLVALLQSEDEGTRLKAAAKILDAGSRLRQDVEIDSRLSALENSHDDNKNSTRAA